MRTFLSIIFSTLVIFSSCTKETADRYPNTIAPPPSPVPVKKNTAPSAHAGWWDIAMLWPQNSTKLSGGAFDAENNIVSYSWKKISGPDAYTIEYPGAKETMVKDLQKGKYEFEFTVTDSGGLTSKDAVTVTVFDNPLPGPAEVILQTQQWACPMSCSLVISCFSCYVPAGAAFTIYVKRMNSNNWVQALPETTSWEPNKIYYNLANGDINLSADDENITDIKIKY